MGLLVFYIIAFIASILVARFCFKYNRALHDQKSEQHRIFVDEYPQFFGFMKFAMPVVFGGFVLISVSSLVGIVTQLLLRLYG